MCGVGNLRRWRLEYSDMSTQHIKIHCQSASSHIIIKKKKIIYGVKYICK